MNNYKYDFELDFDNLETIKELTFYNHVYYKLPFELFGCNINYQEWCDCEGVLENSIGIIENGKYIRKYDLPEWFLDNGDFKWKFNFEDIIPFSEKFEKERI